ncbi:lasso peptide biosynthesis B2 protein [Nocardia blacklockiae]|uniref:lasso peptide biosynthesis B2 protein n=1 Tax=Nocardia blacklockiae TaxID=480036 RepID=UPI001896314C|nr:lasso peptide biosynthesis B2 protein [Nocardia blacklockiae]MBF6170908.1 lasso peptide biosynthesis B2 protein [Nocardia blacklockiae]
MTQAMYRARTAPPLGLRMRAVPAVLAARLLATRSPRTIRRVLSFVRRGSAPASREQAARAMDAVLAVSTRCSGRYCLERSLAVVLLSRTAGVWPTWCIGVRASAPFTSHAWVAAEGAPVGESGSLAGYHIVLSE